MIGFRDGLAPQGLAWFLTTMCMWSGLLGYAIVSAVCLSSRGDRQRIIVR